MPPSVASGLRRPPAPKILALILAAGLAQLDFGQVKTQSFSVPAGTGVEIELLQDLSSETLKANQTIPFKLVRPLELNGRILLPAGTPVTGVIEALHASRRWGKKGAFKLAFQPLKLADGTLVHIDFYHPHLVEGDKANKVAEDVVAGVWLAYYFPLIPFAIGARARKGKPLIIRSGERYLVYVTSTEAAQGKAAEKTPKR